MSNCGCDVKARAKALMGDGKAPFMMATVDAEGRPCVRWMGLFCKDPDNEWVLYAACASKSRKMQQIAGNCNMQLIFTGVDYSDVATLIGTAAIVTDQPTKSLCWSAMPGLDEYFSGPEGKDFGLIRFTTQKIEFLALKEQHEPYFADV